MHSICGNLVDLFGRCIDSARLVIDAGRIQRIQRLQESQDNSLLPGFVDAHVQVESAMLTPSNFARAAVVRGTVATVSDPPENGNVVGESGVRAPATMLEIAGAEITVEQVKQLLADPQIGYFERDVELSGCFERTS